MNKDTIINNEYETPKFVPLQDFELMDVNGGGLVSFVFAAVYVVALAMVISIGAVYSGVIGVNMTVSEYEE